jgi:nicotinamidase-related amidase
MTAALIVIDMLNPYEHEDAEPLIESVAEALPSLRELIREAPRAGVLTVYVNDNHGGVTEQCILYSALDAYVRHFEVVVPRDAVAHIHEDLAVAAFRMMEENMRADVTDSVQDALEAAAA